MIRVGELERMKLKSSGCSSGDSKVDSMGVKLKVNKAESGRSSIKLDASKEKACSVQREKTRNY